MSAKLPNIIGDFCTGFRQGWSANGAFSLDPEQFGPRTTQTAVDVHQASYTFIFNAGKFNAVYTDNCNIVQPQSICTLLYIKY